MVGHVRVSLAGAMVAHLRAVKAANLAAEEQLTPGAPLVEGPRPRPAPGLPLGWRLL